MSLEVKSKCKHCGEVFTIRKGFALEHPYAETKKEWEEASFMNEGSGVEAFCPKCRKYEIMIQHTRMKRCRDFMEIGEIMEGFSFAGKIKEWEKWIANIPQENGVYVVIRKEDDVPVFCEIGSGGHFKGKNPNVSIEKLAKKWYYSDNRVMYIGRANYNITNPKFQTCKSTLQSRIKDYMRFGGGEKIGHWGGRYIWQIADAGNLEVWYKVCDNPQTIEGEMIKKYEPFANLKSGDRV